MPTISIIVPVYKVEEYLPACIRSILRQTYRDFELILVDDGSPDRCGEICDEFAKQDERIRVIHQENGGVSRARNTGMDHAIGEWITFVDSDDLITPRYLASFDLHDNGETDLIVQGLRYLQKGKLYNKTIFPNRKAPIRELLNKKLTDFRGPYCKLFRRNIIQSHRLYFPEDIPHCEDAIFYYQYLLIIEDIKTVKSARYLYRHDRDDSATCLPVDPQLFWQIEETMTALLRKLYHGCGCHLPCPYPSRSDILFLEGQVMGAYQSGYGYSKYRRFIAHIKASETFRQIRAIENKSRSESLFCRALLLPCWMQWFILPIWSIYLKCKNTLKKLQSYYNCI